MRLPNVDQFREPFVLPIGHLAMQAAYAEAQLIGLCSTTSLPEAEPIGAVTKKLRNWTESAKRYAVRRALLIRDEGIRHAAIEAIGRYDDLREQRHRAIHDAIDVGLEGEEDSGYAVVPLGVQNAPSTRHEVGGPRLYQLTAEKLAELACELEDVQKTFAMIIWHLER